LSFLYQNPVDNGVNEHELFLHETKANRKTENKIHLICRLWGRRGRPPWSCLRLSSAAWAKCHSGWSDITHCLRGECTNYNTLHFTHILGPRQDTDTHSRAQKGWCPSQAHAIVATHLRN